MKLLWVSSIAIPLCCRFVFFFFWWQRRASHIFYFVSGLHGQWLVFFFLGSCHRWGGLFVLYDKWARMVNHHKAGWWHSTAMILCMPFLWMHFAYGIIIMEEMGWNNGLLPDHCERELGIYCRLRWVEGPRYIVIVMVVISVHLWIYEFGKKYCCKSYRLCYVIYDIGLHCNKYL
jgi:hypothetical protein